MENRAHTIKLIFRNINRTTDLHLFWFNMSLICFNQNLIALEDSDLNS